ncbi:unnamed protein product, partial [Ectocarpus sp. 12 AP-2014]
RSTTCGPPCCRYIVAIGVVIPDVVGIRGFVIPATLGIIVGTISRRRMVAAWGPSLDVAHVSSGLMEHGTVGWEILWSGKSKTLLAAAGPPMLRLD